MTNQLQNIQGGGSPSLAMTQVAQSRELQEVHLRFVMANQFPRNLNLVRQNIAEECKDKELAEAAEYVFPRGGATVKGASIKLMEAIAKYYGNIESGVRVLERRVGSSTIEVYALDLQTNTRQSIVFDVSHVRGKKSGQEKLTDERDIYEMEANFASRRKRKCLEALIPKSLVDEAIKLCHETTKNDNSKTHAKRLEQLLKTFEKFGVDKGSIEKFLEKTTEEFTPDDFQTMLGVYTAIKDGQQTVGEVFPNLQADFPDSKGLTPDEPNEG